MSANSGEYIFVGLLFFVGVILIGRLISDRFRKS